jgi:probable phosphoglycerate mutase
MDNTAPVNVPISDTSPDGAQPRQPAKPPRLVMLVRHGETTYNVERRLPGQLPGVALTDEGRRQAHRTAVALSNLPLSAVVASPLERARETGEIIARGWALPVRTDPRLLDTDIGAWAGKVIDDLNKADPNWKAFVEHPSEPPAGVEGFPQVQARAVAAVEDILRDESLGSYIVVVAHADVVKLILAHYTRMHIQAVRYVSVGTASISALAFQGEQPPHILGVNWTPLPDWLAPSPARPPTRDADQRTQPGAGGTVEPPHDPSPPPVVS